MMQYFVVMIDYGRRGREAIVDPEITRREVIARAASGEYKNISFIHEIADAAVDDITPRFWRRQPFPKSRPPGPICRPTASIMPAISASTRPCEGMRRLPAKRPRNTGLTSSPACSAVRKASHAPSAPALRHGTARRRQNLPQDHRSWIRRRLALRFVHMRRSRTAPAPQARLV